MCGRWRRCRRRPDNGETTATSCGDTDWFGYHEIDFALLVVKRGTTESAVKVKPWHSPSRASSVGHADSFGCA
jgi:hypothetical protein